MTPPPPVVSGDLVQEEAKRRAFLAGAHVLRAGKSVVGMVDIDLITPLYFDSHDSEGFFV